jgi:hypothetical protein
MVLRSDPSNPEAALIPKGKERPSLEWIHFAIEELTLLKISVDNKGNGTRLVFMKLAKVAGWSKNEIGTYLGWANLATARDGYNSVGSNDPELREAHAAIEQMITR